MSDERQATTDDPAVYDARATGVGYDEPGSDALLERDGILPSAEAVLLQDRWRSAAEERALRALHGSPRTPEPGEDFPDPDQGPPPQGEPDYDPEPPEGGNVSTTPEDPKDPAETETETETTEERTTRVEREREAGRIRDPKENDNGDDAGDDDSNLCDADRQPVATSLQTVIALVVLIAGGAMVVFSRHYVIEEYLNTLALLSVGVGLLGIGRGLQSAGRSGAAGRGQWSTGLTVPRKPPEADPTAFERGTTHD